MKDFLTTPLLVGLMDQDCQIKIKIYFGLNIRSRLYDLTQRNCTTNATFYDKICCRPLHEYCNSYLLATDGQYMYLYSDG